MEAIQAAKLIEVLNSSTPKKLESLIIISIIEFRDEKRVKFTKSALDNSLEEHDEILSNEAFIGNLQDKTFNIIF